jgi:hypothetical protein
MSDELRLAVLLLACALMVFAGWASGSWICSRLGWVPPSDQS